MIIFILMIFNSITRELNHNDRKYQQTSNTQQSYFPQKRLFPNDIFQNVEEKHYPRQKNQSALSKMNNKISENIEYLRYKDQVRRSQLRSSRVSVSSNRSIRSNHSSKSNRNPQIPSSFIQNKSNTSSQLRTYLPPQQSKVKTFVPLDNYRTEHQTTQSNYNYWKNSNLKSETAQELTSNQFKYFTRNPVTIDTKTYAYRQEQRRQPERDAPQQLHRSIRSQQSQSFDDFPQQTQQIRTSTLQSEFPKQPLSREWNTSFGGSLKNSNINQRKQNIVTFEEKEKEKVTQKPQPDVFSPLQPKKVSPKSSLIISAGLIALGVIILLLQILK